MTGHSQHGISRLLQPTHAFTDIQLVRGVLGLLNAASFIIYAIGVRTAFGTTVGLWYIALQASQFHIIYYASRTLPNMFAFGISAYHLEILFRGFHL
jgi:alpha-1,6-mannosyltransferase